MKNISILFTLLLSSLCFSQDYNTNNFQFNGQFTYISQTIFPFNNHRFNSGIYSLNSLKDTESTQSYTFYLGYRINHNLDIYVDPEWSLGNGINNGTGIASYPSGEVIRVPAPGTPGASAVPYFARAFIKYSIPISGSFKQVEGNINQIPGKISNNNIVINAGKFSASDVFDQNSYANSGRNQFMNWSFINNLSYDYAADLRGYSYGASVEWNHPSWILRLGSFAMPMQANSIILGSIFSQNRGDQIELEEHYKNSILRILAYRNIGNMGQYLSNDIHISTNSVKYGYGLNYEQSLCDNGTTGIFARLGYNPGSTESFAFAECDSSISAGIQISGKHLKIKDDIMGIGISQASLNKNHALYLESGGEGFILSGPINYSPERIFEIYYNHNFDKSRWSIGPDLQIINNAGYNMNTNTWLLGFRAHLSF